MATFATRSSSEDLETPFLSAEKTWLTRLSRRLTATAAVLFKSQTLTQSMTFPRTKTSLKEKRQEIKSSRSSSMDLTACAATTMVLSQNKNGTITTLTFPCLFPQTSTSWEWWNQFGKYVRTKLRRWARSKLSTWPRLCVQSCLISQQAKPKKWSSATPSASSTLTAMAS